MAEAEEALREPLTDEEKTMEARRARREGASVKVYLLTYLSTTLPTYQPPYLPTYLPIYLPSYLPTYLHLPTYIPTYVLRPNKSEGR